MSFPNPDNYAQDCDCNPNSAALAPTAINDQLLSLQSQITVENTTNNLQAAQISSLTSQVNNNFSPSIAKVAYIPGPNFNIPAATEYFPNWGSSALSGATSTIAALPTSAGASPLLLSYGTSLFFPQYGDGNYTFIGANVGYSGSPARISINSEGFYRFSMQFYGYDLKDNNRVALKLWRWDAANSFFNVSSMVVAKKRYPGTIPFALDDGDSIEGSVVIPVRASATSGSFPAYTMSFLSYDLSPYTNSTFSLGNLIPTFSFDIQKLRGP